MYEEGIFKDVIRRMKIKGAKPSNETCVSREGKGIPNPLLCLRKKRGDETVQRRIDPGQLTLADRRISVHLV